MSTAFNCPNMVTLSAIKADSLSFGSSGNIFGYSDMKNLVNFGGLIGLKSSFNSSYAFNRLPNLNYESCINILNGLYDFTGNGETPNSSQGKLKVHSNFLSLVGEEISIGTSKGWTITA